MVHESVVDEPASSEMDRARGGEIDIVDDIQRSLYQNGISQIEKYSGGEIEGPAPDKSHFIRNGEEIVIVEYACIGVSSHVFKRILGLTCAGEYQKVSLYIRCHKGIRVFKMRPG